MARRICLLVPSAIACVIFGCGGANDPGLFSAGGGNSGVSGASSAGAASVPNAGSTAAGGDTSDAGSVGLGDSGADSVGGNSSAGSDSGGAGAGEAGHSSSGGSGGSVDQAGTGGGAGHSEGGSSGHAEGGSSGHAEGGSSGHAEGGTAGSGVAGGAGSGSGGKGSAGAGNEPTCAELFTQAATELTAARACNVDANAEQCTGKVQSTCNCQVPVEKDDSPATKAYQATLKQLQAKHCSQVCPAIACTPVFNAECRASDPGSNKGTCVASFPGPIPMPAF